MFESSYVLCGALIAAAMVLLWLLSLRLRDVSIVDIFWGLGFVLVAWTTWLTTEGESLRRPLLVGLTTLWGTRLSAYLAWRNLGRGEDARYAAMRAKRPASFPLISLFMIFGLQGALILLISMPTQAALRAAGDSPLGVLDFAGAAVTLLGITFETLGDAQLARFKAAPENRGKVMNRGLWRYTRHPNYFGDFLMVWGLYLIAASGGQAWTVFAPLAMSFLLLRVSGVTLLEQTMAQRPGYAEYIARTSSFFPWPPREG